MTDSEFIFHACERKIRYKKKQSAINAWNKQRKCGKIMPKEPEIYHCQFCNGWHIGNKRS